ncbi:MAG: hypothetical protein ACK5XV_06555 [Flavobacteriales bacterium]
MRQLSILIMMSVCMLQAAAQKAAKPVKFTHGPEYEARRSAVSAIIGSTEAGTVIVRYQKKKGFLELVNSKGSVTISKPLSELKYNKLAKKFINGIFLGDRLFLRFGAYDKSKKNGYGFVDEYDPKTLNPIGNVSKQTIDASGAKSMYWYGIGLSRALDELTESGDDVSPSENYVLEYTSSFTKDKNSPETVNLRVFDGSYKPVWEKEFEIPYSNELFKINKVVVDDAGNTHLVGREYENTKEQRKGTAAFKYHVISFLNQGETVQDNEFILKGKYITDMAIGINQNQEVMASGFYSNEGFSSIDGSFAMKVNPTTGAILQTNVKEFSSEFLRQGMTEKEEKKADRKEAKGEDLELTNFDLDEIWFTPDGGCILVAEQFYVTYRTVTTTSANGGTSTRQVPVYHYDDVIAVKISPQCDIEWNQKISKSGTSYAPTGPVSYISSDCNGDLVFLYNVQEKKTNEVHASIVHPNGEVEHHTVMKSERDELSLYPMYSAKLADCKMLLYFNRGKVYQFSHAEVLQN